MTHTACQEAFLSAGLETTYRSLWGKNETVNRIERYRLVENKCEPDLPKLFGSETTEGFKLASLMIFMPIKT